MNSKQAKEILMLYRPGSADAQDPAFAEALRLCEVDPELKRWFDDHCAVYRALRARMKVAVPAGLKEQILAERKAHLAPGWRRPAALVAAAMAIVLAGLVVMQLKPTQPIQKQSREEVDFGTFRSRMVSSALRLYQMDLATNNLDQIRAHLAERNAPANYVLPNALPQNAQPTGCAINFWQGKRVAMICFSSQPAGQTNDLWLFVIENTAVPDAPATATPVVERVNRATTATWTEAGTTYILVANGDEAFIRKFL